MPNFAKPVDIELMIFVGQDSGHKTIPFVAKSNIKGEGLTCSLEGHNIAFVESYLKCCLEAIAIIKGENDAGDIHRIIM